MLTMPTLEEQPQPVIALLRQYVEADGAILRAGHCGSGGGAASGDLARPANACHSRSRSGGPGFPAAPMDARSIVACRERARLKQALLYTRCRRVALRDRRRARADSGDSRRPDDVFMLTWQELDELCAGRAMFPRGVAALVQTRREQHALESRLTPPDTFVSRRTVQHSRRRQRRSRQRRPADADDGALRGTTACGGSVTAPAAVLAGVHEAHRLRRGDVLVTRQTDPGWAPVFCLVSGLVIERGGMLSHGAIIAREFGLPCVVGVKEATTRIPHGARLTLNADRRNLRGRGRAMRTLAAYVAQRFPPAVFAPAIISMTGAAVWSVHDPSALAIARASLLGLVLVAQFRLWDDMEDADRDRVTHPERVLVRAPAGPFRALHATLIVAAAAMCIERPAALVAVLSLEAGFWCAYRRLRPHIRDDAWRFGVLLTQVPGPSRRNESGDRSRDSNPSSRRGNHRVSLRVRLRIVARAPRVTGGLEMSTAVLVPSLATATTDDASDTYPFESVSCLSCGNDRAGLFLTGGDDLTGTPGQFTFVRCDECGLVYQSPRLTASASADYYDNEYIAHQTAHPLGTAGAALSRGNEIARSRQTSDRAETRGARRNVRGPGRRLRRGLVRPRGAGEHRRGRAAVDLVDLSARPALRDVEFHHGLFYDQPVGRASIRSRHDVALPGARLRSASIARSCSRCSPAWRVPHRRGPAPRQLVVSHLQESVAGDPGPAAYRALRPRTTDADCDKGGLRRRGAPSARRLPPYFYLFCGVAFTLLRGRGLNLERAIYAYFAGQLLVLPLLPFLNRMNFAMQTIVCRRGR